MTPKKLLAELKAFDKEKSAIVTTLRDLILTHKNTSEEVKYGGLLYSLKKPYTGIFVYKNHVTLEFTDGAKFDDPNQLLQGSGKHRRHLQFKSSSDIKKSVVQGFLKQARGTEK